MQVKRGVRQDRKGVVADAPCFPESREGDCEEEGVWIRSAGFVWRCSRPGWMGGR